MNSQAVIDDRVAGDSAPVRRIVPDPLPVAFDDVRLNGLGVLDPCIRVPGDRVSRDAGAPPDPYWVVGQRGSDDQGAPHYLQRVSPDGVVHDAYVAEGRRDTDLQTATRQGIGCQ